MNIGNLVTQFGEKGIRLIKNQCPKLEFDDKHQGFDECNAVLRKICKEKFDQHRIYARSKKICYITPGCTYVIKMQNMSGMIVNCDNNPIVNSIEITIFFYGKNKLKIREKFVNMLEKELQGCDKITIANYDTHTYARSRVEPHDIRKMVLDPHVKANIIAGLHAWRSSIDWYHDHQLLHKIGILLYGAPGCGKSTIIRSIATMFNNAPIVMIDPSSVSSSLKDINILRYSTDDTIIVVFEDFDMMFYDRNHPDKNSDDIAAMKENQNIAFQILDGLYSTDNTIYIATTNHIDKLDPAMIRHGRFDIQEEITGFNEELTMKLLNQFGYGKEFYDQYIKDNFEFPIQPAKLQSFILEYRSNEMLKLTMNKNKKN